MDNVLLKKENFHNFAGALAKIYDLYVTQKGREGSPHLVKYSPDTRDIVIGDVRPFEPLKNFFFSAREKVVDGYEKSAEISQRERRPACILGVKNCDLFGLHILDFVFAEGDLKEPFYIRQREKNLIIASDCTRAIETCFCHSLGHRHYPESNYDILMSDIGAGFLIEAATEKGKKFLDDNKGLFSGITENHTQERDHIRRQVGELVEKNIKDNEIPPYKEYKDIINKNIESKIWEDEMETCVECGSCNVVCPTCHCFYLVDSVDGKHGETRFKIWDSCMYRRFAVVAGGANPRAHLWMRLRNRFEKKFDYFPEVGGHYACTGCGRCISGCPAKIDIRKVLKNLVAAKKGHKVTRSQGHK